MFDRTPFRTCEECEQGVIERLLVMVPHPMRVLRTFTNLAVDNVSVFGEQGLSKLSSRVGFHALLKSSGSFWIAVAAIATNIATGQASPRSPRPQRA